MDPDSIGFVDPDPYGEQEDQDDPQRKESSKIHFLKCVFYLGAGGFCNLKAAVLRIWDPVPF